MFAFKRKARLMRLNREVRHLSGPASPSTGPGEVLLLCRVRNGRHHIDSFLRHYRKLGASHFVFLDNGSGDGTVESLAGEKDVTVYQTLLPFKNYSVAFKQWLIGSFAKGRWSLEVDSDEFFDYPFSDVLPLAGLIRYLEENAMTAVPAQMLDMFPEVLARDSGQPFSREDHCYYDLSNIDTKAYSRTDNVITNPEISLHFGGIRKTLFRTEKILLTKHPLARYGGKMRLHEEGHKVCGARIADFSAVLLHFKFTGPFHDLVNEAVRKEQYYDNSKEYKAYHKVLKNSPELRMRQSTSKKLKGINDLVDEGFLNVSQQFRKFASGMKAR